MKVWSYHRGHKVHAEQDEDGVYAIWKYSDGVKIKDEPDRPCTRCGKTDVGGHDHCISNLPDVEYACCGHGVEDGYVKLNNGKYRTFNTDLNKEEIIQIVNELKRNI